MTREEFLEVMRVALEIRLLQTGITLTRIEICEITEYRQPILVCRFCVRGRDEYDLSVALPDEIFDRRNVRMRDALAEEILHRICTHIDLQTSSNTNRWVKDEEGSFKKLSKKWTQAYAN